MEGRCVSVKFGAERCARSATGRRPEYDEMLDERRMSAFEEYREEWESHKQMYGKERGRLAVSLDRITNALVITGQHGVYCTNQRKPTVPAMDLRIISAEL